MSGLGFGCGLERPLLKASVRRNIVAWGDSLTAGVGASDDRHRYPAAAAALFEPPRDVLNRGIGGQISTQIAARQGGVPILVTLDGGTIPEARAWSWTFDDGLQGWYGRAVGAPVIPTLLAVVDGALAVSGQAGVVQAGAQVWLGPDALPAGAVCTVGADVLGPSPAAQVGFTTASAHGQSAPWAGGGFSWPAGTGRKSVTFTVAAQNGRALLFYYGTSSAAPITVLDNADLLVRLPVAITEKSVNVLYNSGVYTGAIAGTIAGVHGVMTTDSAGNWTFTRDRPGPAVPCPPDIPFIPDETVSLRGRTAWIWSGRNNAHARQTVVADIAAMVAHLGHGRYLVGSVLNGAGEGIGTGAYGAIAALNADLAAAHGIRFVDLRGALVAAGDPVADAADIAADRVPASLRSDGVHLNDAGQAIVASAMQAAMLALGW